MADKYTLRKFLIWKALIHREDDPRGVADRFLAKNPKLDRDQVKTWDQWNDEFPDIQLVEDVPVSEAYL